MGNVSLIIYLLLLLHVVLLSYLVTYYMFTLQTWKLDIGKWVEEIDSTCYKIMGICLCIGLSILGAGMGIYCVGSSLLGVGTKKIHVKTKNLISVIFCEASAIYGIVMAIVMVGHLNEKVEQMDQGEELTRGYILLGAGLIAGTINFFSGVAIGVVGSGVVLADANNPKTFVRNVLLEIFAGALGLFGLIAGIYMLSKAK